MKSSCIPHPPNEPLIVIRKWQVEACGGFCEAALLSFFEYWHNIKLDLQQKAMATKKSGGRKTVPGLYQHHTAKELSDGVLGLYGEKTIRHALRRLENLGFVITIRNPNPKYGFDATKHFVFVEEKVRECAVLHSSGKSAGRCGKKAYPYGESAAAIPETSSEIPIQRKVKGSKAFEPCFSYPSDEEEMYRELEEYGIEPNPDYDGSFFTQHSRNDWKINGEPIWDWHATYAARLLVTSPGGF